MSDTGQIITVPDEMTVLQLIQLEADTQGRFSYVIEENGLEAVCSWVNYYTNAQGKREKDGNGAYKLLIRESKKVAII